MNEVKSLTFEQPSVWRLQLVQHLMNGINSSDATDRASSEAKLLAMGHDAIPSMLIHLNVTARTKADNRRGMLIGLSGLCGLVVLGLLMAQLKTDTLLDTLLFAMTCFFPLLRMLWKIKEDNEIYRGIEFSELALLLRVADRRSIPVLIDLHFRIPDVHQKWRVRQGLTRLLPDLGPADASLTPSAYVARLVRLLDGANGWQEPRDVGFAVATLKALEHIGNNEALRMVQRLASSARDGGIRQAACYCLPHLKARLRKQRAGGTLLRASSHPRASGELLRAAPALSSHAHELLRAGTDSRREGEN